MYDNISSNLPPRGGQSWLPQREEGTNIDAATSDDLAVGDLIPGFARNRVGVHNTKRYCFDGNVVYPFDAAIQPDIIPYRIVSVYHDRSVIYHVDYNAAVNGVGEANTSTNSDMFMDWSEIQFRHGGDGSSRIDTNAAHGLQMTRANCIWSGSLIPPRYHPEAYRDHLHVTTPAGCLGGSLALLVALVALSATPENPTAVDAALRGALNGSNWGVAHQHGHPGCRGASRHIVS
jgi:hypothetical protein